MKVCFKKTDIDLVSCRKITLCLHVHGVNARKGKWGPLWVHMWGCCHTYAHTEGFSMQSVYFLMGFSTAKGNVF